MENYQCKTHIAASPQKVYQALTEKQGLQNWWTSDCDIESKQGEKLTFRFDNTYSVMLVERLIPNKEVVWKCIDQNHTSELFSGPPDEWVGTQLIFEIKDDGKVGTDLLFSHQGLNPSLKCYKICNVGWNHFIKKSLKDFLEKGQGHPYESSMEAKFNRTA